MIHLKYLSAIQLSGTDAGDFLQSQLSADIKALEPGQSTFAAYCTPRGQVLGLLLVCRSNDHYQLVASAQLLPGIVKRLKIFVMRSRVDWQDLPGLPVFGVSDDSPASANCEVFSPPSLSLTYATGPGESGDSDDESGWKSSELLQGVAWLDSSTTEKFIPQMLGQDDIGALSFSKGCYPGQEIVARTRYLGKVKRKPLIVTVPGIWQFPGAGKLAVNYQDQSINGAIIDSAVSEERDTVVFLVTNLLDDQKPESLTFEGETIPLQRSRL